MVTTRSRRGADTAQRILDATARLLADREPASVSLDRISKEVGVAKTSILWHFGSKKGLLLAVVDRVFDDFVSGFVQQNPDSGDVELELRAFLRAYARFLREQPQINTVLMSMLFDRELGADARARIAALYAQFRQAITEHYTLDGKPLSPAFASAVIAFVDGVFLQWFADPEGVDIEAIFEAFVQHFVPGDP